MFLFADPILLSVQTTKLDKWTKRQNFLGSSSHVPSLTYPSLLYYFTPFLLQAHSLTLSS